MKTRKIVLGIVVLLLAGTAVPAMADPPSEPPPMPGSHGSGGNQGPSGAPIDGGLGILFLLGTVWAGMQIRQERKERR